MSLKLTKKQTLILNFISDFTEENGYSPSYREIASGLKLSSVSAVAEHIDNLTEKGALKKIPGAARSLQVIDTSHPETVALFKLHLINANEKQTDILLEAAKILDIKLDSSL